MCWPWDWFLETYTSPVLVVHGKPIRVQFLKPIGWNDVRFTNERSGKDVFYTVEAHEPPNGAGFWGVVNSVYALGDREPGMVWFTTPAGPAGTVGTIELDYQTIPSAGCKIAGKPGGRIDYSDSNRRHFDALYRRICTSAKILPP